MDFLVAGSNPAGCTIGPDGPEHHYFRLIPSSNHLTHQHRLPLVTHPTNLLSTLSHSPVITSYWIAQTTFIQHSFADHDSRRNYRKSTILLPDNQSRTNACFQLRRHFYEQATGVTTRTTCPVQLENAQREPQRAQLTTAADWINHFAAARISARVTLFLQALQLPRWSSVASTSSLRLHQHRLTLSWRNH